MKESSTSLNTFRKGCPKILFSEESDNFNKTKSLIKFNTSNIENRIQEKLKCIKVVSEKAKDQQEYDLALPLIKTEVKERINNLLSPSKNESKRVSRKSIDHSRVTNVCEGNYNLNLIHPKKFIRDYLERDIFNEDIKDKDDFYEKIEKRINKKNTQQINLVNAKKVQYLMQSIPYQKINLLEVKENIIDYKTKSRNKNAELFKSVSEDFIPKKTVFRNKFLEKTKPHLVDHIISSSLSISNNKFGEYFYKNIYGKFDINNRIKFVEKRNDLFTKSMSKTRSALIKYENMINKDEF